MSIEFQIILLILIHWVADFVLQTESMGTQKSKSNYWLSMHVITYTLTWYFIGLCLVVLSIFTFMAVIKFCAITFIAHFITDFFSSRLTGYFYRHKKFYGLPGFWTTIGFDQVLHYAQLIICYEYFTQ